LDHEALKREQLSTVRKGTKYLYQKRSIQTHIWNFRWLANGAREMLGCSETNSKQYAPNIPILGIYAARRRDHTCRGQRATTMKKSCKIVLLLASLLSFSFGFPFGYTSIHKLNPREKTVSRALFRQTCHPLQFKYTFVPDVFVLSLSSTPRSPEQDLDRDPTDNRKQSCRKSNKIKVKSIDKEGQELPLRTIEFRRRKHQWAERYTSQEGLRDAFGSNRNKWWGDLDAKTARRLYKSLLFPTALSELVLELGDEIVRPEELAPLAYEARRAAKMYVRERCRVPSRVGAYLFDGFRQLRKYGKFQPNGPSYEQLWIRYYEENGNLNTTDNEWEYLFGDNNNDLDDGLDSNDDIRDIIDGIDDDITEEEIIKRTCQKILEKSCTTNEAIDRFFLNDYDLSKEDKNINSERVIEENDGCSENTFDDEEKDLNGKIIRGRRWKSRKKKKDRYNDLLLQRITKTLEKDVRKLLDPEFFDDSHDEACNLYGPSNESIKSNESRTKEGNLSSRRMTAQEYHSLKLFAKARRYSQQNQEKDSTLNEITNRQQSGKNYINGSRKGITVLSPAIIADLNTMENKDK